MAKLLVDTFRLLATLDDYRGSKSVSNGFWVPQMRNAQKSAHNGSKMAPKWPCRGPLWPLGRAIWAILGPFGAFFKRFQTDLQPQVPTIRLNVPSNVEIWSQKSPKEPPKGPPKGPKGAKTGKILPKS